MHGIIGRSELTSQVEEDWQFAKNEKRYTEATNFNLYRYREFHNFLDRNNVRNRPVLPNHHDLMTMSDEIYYQNRKRLNQFVNAETDYWRNILPGTLPDAQSDFKQYIRDLPLNKITSVRNAVYQPLSSIEIV